MILCGDMTDVGGGGVGAVGVYPLWKDNRPAGRGGGAV